MQVDQLSWTESTGWRSGSEHGGADLILFFGMREALACGARYRELRAMFPAAHILGCSTGGQIHNDEVTDEEITAVALRFEATSLRIACEPAKGAEHSRKCGEAIGHALSAHDLAGIFILSDGLNINGSELVAGVAAIVGPAIPVTGGLAGDGARFAATLVGGDCEPARFLVAAVGFYSYGEISPHSASGVSELHNQTMTVTAICERAG
ncbi:MAG: FIST N-terminal domain-containing protein [Xanthobacteraceae bacterium]